jgi:hypothetical protein
MELIDSEEILWSSKNGRFILSNLRLREENKRFLGSSIKSITIDDITGSELRTKVNFKFLRSALWFFMILNGGVYLMNNFLFNSELIKMLFGEIHIGGGPAHVVFVASLVIAAFLVLATILSYDKVFSFHTSGLTIDVRLRGMDFSEREHFITTIERSKTNRQEYLSGRKGKS